MLAAAGHGAPSTSWATCSATLPGPAAAGVGRSGRSSPQARPPRPASAWPGRRPAPPHAPKVARLLEDAQADLLAFSGFAAEHCQRCPPPPLERSTARPAAPPMWPGAPQRRRPAAAGRDAGAGAEPRVAGRPRYLSATPWPWSSPTPPLNPPTQTPSRLPSSPHHPGCYPPTTTSHTTKYDLTPLSGGCPIGLLRPGC